MDPQQMQELMKLAGTQPGRKLLSMLHRTAGPELRNALNQQDYERAKEIVKDFIRDPTVQDLLKQLEK